MIRSVSRNLFILLSVSITCIFTNINNMYTIKKHGNATFTSDVSSTYFSSEYRNNLSCARDLNRVDPNQFV